MFALIVIVPTIIFYAIFHIYPLSYMFYLAFHKWKMLSPVRPFIGLDNFVKLFGDEVFWISFKNTFYYAGIVIPVNLCLSLLIALLIIKTSRSRVFFLTVYFFPYITSTIACGFVWKWLYQPQMGLFNNILKGFSLPPQQWLQSTKTALPSIMLMSIWKGYGYAMVIFLAGLLEIPKAFYEASKIDGANRWQDFYAITLPLLKPTFIFIFIIISIETLAIQSFTPIYVLTSGQTGVEESFGGPLYSTTTMVVYAYKLAFHQLNLGYSAAAVIFLFILVLVLTIFQLRFGKVKWEY